MLDNDSLSLSLSPSLPPTHTYIVLQEWIDILTNGIAHAIHNQQSSFSEDFEVISPYEDTPSSPLEPSSPDPILEKSVK